MDEAAELCDRVGIMDHGHLLALDTPEALTRDLPGANASTSPSRRLPAATEAQLVELLEQLRGNRHGSRWCPKAAARSRPNLTSPRDVRLRLYLSRDARLRSVPSR